MVVLKNKKVIFILIGILFSITLNVKAYEPDYEITNYNINMIVNEDNSYDITETIDVNFNVLKTGIYRNIPLESIIPRKNGTFYVVKPNISNLMVNNYYVTNITNNEYKIIIGDENNPIIGKKQYIISYKYNVGNDENNFYDILYFNLVGSEWDTKIQNFEFKVTMPKSFDSQKLEILEDNYKNINYQVNDKVISGYSIGSLFLNEGVQIRLELPEGYFQKAKLNIWDYLVYIIPIIFLGISILFWYHFGRDDKIKETIEFYPPNGYNSLEIGYLYKGTADAKDVTSLLIYLANKGCLEIIPGSNKNDFKIKKLKEYNGNNPYEQMFFSYLFQKAQNNEVTAANLYNKFYPKMLKILKRIDSKENQEKLFEKPPKYVKGLIEVMIITTYCFITILPFSNLEMPSIFTNFNIFKNSMLFAVVVSGSIGLAIMFSCMFGNSRTIYVNGKEQHSASKVSWFGLAFGLGFTLFPYLNMVFPIVINQDIIYLICHIIGIICIVGMYLVLKNLPKRSKFGMEIMSKILGFKRFLETVEKDKLNAMVLENPTYFYDILPFTYVLGISDKWIKDFEIIGKQDNFNVTSTLNSNTISSIITDTMPLIDSAVSSKPPLSFTNLSDKN